LGKGKITRLFINKIESPSSLLKSFKHSQRSAEEGGVAKNLPKHHLIACLFLKQREQKLNAFERLSTLSPQNLLYHVICFPIYNSTYQSIFYYYYFLLFTVSFLLFEGNHNSRLCCRLGRETKARKKRRKEQFLAH